MARHFVCHAAQERRKHTSPSTVWTVPASMHLVNGYDQHWALRPFFLSSPGFQTRKHRKQIAVQEASEGLKKKHCHSGNLPDQKHGRYLRNAVHVERLRCGPDGSADATTSVGRNLLSDSSFGAVDFRSYAHRRMKEDRWHGGSAPVLVDINHWKTH